jgi:hypothetical protein
MVVLLTTGEFGDVLLEEGLLVRGDQPWLGILFWSTFFTSGMFYAFAITSLLARPLSRILAIGRYLNLETKPLLVMTFIVAVTVTLVFWGTVGGTTLVQLLQ